MKIHDLRQEYEGHPLGESDVDADPIAQFRTWFAEAQRVEVPEPQAMTLATADASGLPSARIVLLKSIDERGLQFFTNYDSAKGCDLAENPRAALLFFWQPIARQVRFQGVVTRLPREESEAYFHSRPRGSQLSALASDQSRVSPDRLTLERRVAELDAMHAGKVVPMPASWGGYALQPDVVEFWQGQQSRLHDRLQYRRADEATWVVERLSP